MSINEYRCIKYNNLRTWSICSICLSMLQVRKFNGFGIIDSMTLMCEIAKLMCVLGLFKYANAVSVSYLTYKPTLYLRTSLSCIDCKIILQVRRDSSVTNSITGCWQARAQSCVLGMLNLRQNWLNLRVVFLAGALIRAQLLIKWHWHIMPVNHIEERKFISSAINFTQSIHQ